MAPAFSALARASGRPRDALPTRRLADPASECSVTPGPRSAGSGGAPGGAPPDPGRVAGHAKQTRFNTNTSHPASPARARARAWASESSILWPADGAGGGMSGSRCGRSSKVRATLRATRFQ